MHFLLIPTYRNSSKYIKIKELTDDELKFIFIFFRPLNCSLITFPTKYLKTRNVIGVSTNFKHSEIFNRYIIRMMSSGIFNFLEQHTIKITNIFDPEKIDKNFYEVKFESIKYILYGYIIGITLSIFILFIEICSKKCIKFIKKT